MKNRTGRRKFLAMVVALGMVASIWATWGARPAQAIIIIGGKTGLFGVTAGQKVRISTVNLAQGRGGIIVPCAKVFDINGNAIAEHEGETLPAGKGTFFDWDASLLDLRAGERAQIRVEAEIEPAPGASGREARIRPEDAAVTIEVFDNDTGKTMFTMPLTLKGFNPQPEPPAAEGQRG